MVDVGVAAWDCKIVENEPTVVGARVEGFGGDPFASCPLLETLSTGLKSGGLCQERLGLLVG